MVVKNKILIGILTYLGAPFGYLIKILYTHSISIEEFGLIYGILGFFALITIFNDFGFSETINYYGVKFYEKKQNLELKFTFYLSIFIQIVTSIILTMIIYFSADYLMINYFKSEISSTILLFFLPYFIFINLTVPIRLMFNVTGKYILNILFTFLQFFFILILSYFFFELKLGIQLIGFLWSIVAIFLFIFYLLMFKKEFKFLKKEKIIFDKIIFFNLKKYAIQAMIGSGFLILLTRIDIIFITYFLGLKEVALYEIALAIVSLILIIVNPIFSIISPVTTKLVTNKNKDKLNLIISKIYKIILIISIPLSIIFLSFPSIIISSLFSKTYIEASSILQIMSISIFFIVYQNLNFYILAGLGKLKERNKVLYIGGIMNLILTYILISNLKLEGVVLSLLITYIYMFIHSFILLYKEKVELNFKEIKLFKIVFSNILFYFLIYFLKNFLEFNLILKSLIIIGISGFIYLLLLFKLKIISIKEIKKLIK